MDIDQLCADTIRVISAESVQKAKSGHPGMAMGAADYAFIIWSKFLKYNPEDTKWLNRDRFVLSAGHGSILLYTLLHLAGFDISLNDLKQFRQWGSKTPGHPEYGEVPGVETTTGPLGQGFANAVGMALAEKMIQARLNKKEVLFDHAIYGILGDGCMMEGITMEAASIAGHLKLDNIIMFYDDNKITIEGSTGLTFSEDVFKKFEAMGWFVVKIDGHDFVQIENAIKQCREYKGKPKLVIASTIIGKGSPNYANTADVHGAPLGEEELKLTKKAFNCPIDKDFCIPDEVYQVFKAKKEQMIREYNDWQAKFKNAMNDPEFKKEYDSLTSIDFNESLKKELYDLFAGKDMMATRSASHEILQVLAEKIKCFIGGSADLGPSNKTELKKYASITADDFSGRNIHFGVRENAMAAICNGIALYGFFLPYCGTFMIFTDYAKPSMRLTALMKLRVIYIMTHDSIFVGEDGPTHQPIEHYMALRGIPNMIFIRPADAIETIDAYAIALRSVKNPTVLSLTRHNIPVINRKVYGKSEVVKGAYIIKKEKKKTIDLIVIATGSEVMPSIKAAEMLEKDGKSIRVVSMPSMELFNKQKKEYKDKILPPKMEKRVSVETGITLGWERYIGLKGLAIGIDRFGMSAPWEVLADKFGFTEQKIYKQIKDYLKRK